jgi:hypothetical protein
MISTFKLCLFMTFTGFLMRSQTLALEDRQLRVQREAGQPAFKFENGVVVTRHNGTAKISRWSESGAPLPVIDSSIAGVSKLVTNDVAVSTTGAVGVAATAASAENRLTSVLIWISPEGKILKVVEVPTFGIRKITFASDGTLWAVGREYDSNWNDVADYPVIRQYDQASRLIKSVLPRSTFVNSGLAPHMDCHVISSGDRIGFLSMSKHEWIEISLDGNILGRWTIPALSKGQALTSVAFGTKSGEPWVSIQVSDPANRSSGLYRLDPQKGIFVEVDTSSFKHPSHPITMLGLQEPHRYAVRLEDSVRWVTVN